MRKLLLQLENLLRQRVDFGVLFVDLFCQSLKLRGVRRFSFVRCRALRGCNRKHETADRAENADSSHVTEILTPADLSDKRVRDIEPVFFQIVTESGVTA